VTFNKCNFHEKTIFKGLDYIREIKWPEPAILFLVKKTTALAAI